MNFDRQLEINEARHHAADHRWLVKMDRLEKACEPLIGELCREGKTVYYVNQLSATGKYTGKTIERTNYHDLIDYLVRNHYVS